MPDQLTLLDLVNKRVIALSRWIDEHNAGKDPEARTWGRLAKVSEEAGEVISAYIGATGQNPRKGTNGTHSEVEQELCDVVLTALGALAHLHENRGDYDVLAQVLNHVDAVYQRAGLSDLCSRCGRPLLGPRPLVKPWLRANCEECGEPLPLLTPEARARIAAERDIGPKVLPAHVMPREFTTSGNAHFPGPPPVTSTNTPDLH